MGTEARFETIRFAALRFAALRFAAVFFLPSPQPLIPI